MRLPDDYDAGPMSQQEFDDLSADEHTEASRLGYDATIAKVVKANQIYAHVTFAEVPTAAQPADTGLSPIATAAAAAVGAGIGATVGGPIVAAAGAATAVAAAVAVTQAAPSSSTRNLADALQAAADRFDVDPKLLAAIAAVESNFDPAAKNPHSSAFGLFQFIDSTWAGVVRQFGAAVGVKETDRRDLKAQCLMGAAFLRDNRDFLAKRLPRQPTAGDCYAAHFLGAATAARLLSGPGDMSSADALGARAPAVIAANTSIFKQGTTIRTVAQVVAELTRRVNAAIGRGIQVLQAG